MELMRGRPIILASRSPRRRMLLEEAGIQIDAQIANIDDGLLDPQGTAAANWTMALAYLKASHALMHVAHSELAEALVIGGDTVCEHDGVIMGQPSSASHARQMLLTMRTTQHRVWSGLCLLWSGGRRLVVEHADVHLGSLSDKAIEAYVQTGAWRGKAGGYNLSDRLEDGWPIQIHGAASTIMGLPMLQLGRLIKEVPQ